MSSLERVPIRDGYGDGLLLAGRQNPSVVALCADLTESTRTELFAKAFPKRFVEIGVAEQNLATVASGLAAAGKIPFMTSYASFSPGRNWEQIRTTICYNNQPVKIIGSHAGISVGPDGATHQALEDIALMRVLPNMTVLVPCDHIEARKATLATLDHPGPVYLRLAREPTPVLTTESTPFKIGQAQVYKLGTDVSLVACGPLVYETLIAAEELALKKISARVINCHTIKPLDEATLLAAFQETGAVVTVEEHQMAGGLGGAIAELATQYAPVPIERVGVRDRYGESGPPEILLEHFHLKARDITAAAVRALKRKEA